MMFRRSRSRSRWFDSDEPKITHLQIFQSRLRLAALFMVVGALVIFFRAFFLQYLSFEKYLTQAENNRIKVVPVMPTRGTISDRNGTILAHNFSTFTLEIAPSKIADLDSALKRLSEIIEITPLDLRRFSRSMEESRDYCLLSDNCSLPLRTRLTDEEVAKFAARKYAFPGVEIEARLYRQYPYKTAASHAIGYIGRINDRDVEHIKAAEETANYRGTNHIGKLGIEAAYEKELHGITGSEQVEVDVLGRPVRSLSLTPPIAGDNIELTIDFTLQQIGETLMADNNGAIVAMDPSNGDILALISMPGFEPSLFIEGINSATWTALNTSPDKPLLNRALRGAYPPGSTIKPYLALSALESGKRRPSDAISDPGFFNLPGTSLTFRDDKKGGHGRVDMSRAIIESCDTYFYVLASETKIDDTARFLAPFGFGQKTGIDIDGEVTGVLPSSAWKRERFSGPSYREDHRRWYTGDSISAGIGQSYNNFTPLQLVQAVSALAMNGAVYRPRLLKRVIDSTTGFPTEAKPQLVRQIDLKAENAQFIRQSMTEVNQHGTAARSFWGAPYKSAGKTGTAQVYSLKGEKYEHGLVPKHLRDHALFIAYAPVEDPKIAVAIIVENGGFGARAAAPIARAMFDYYLLHKSPDETPQKPPSPKIEADWAEEE